MSSEVPPKGEGRCPYCGFWHITNERKCCLAARDLEAAASRERKLEAQLDDEKAKVRGLRAELGLVKARAELAEARVAELERELEECQQNR